MYTFGPTLSRHDALPIVWFLLTTAAAISIAGNALHAYISETARLDPMVAVIGGTIPPAFLLLSTHGLSLLLRFRQEPTGADAEEASVVADGEIGRAHV